MADEHENGRNPAVEAENDERQETAERPAIDPEREARRRRALQMIRTFGDPSLKARALEVTKFDDALAEEIAKMSYLMEEALGIGLAATQVGVMHRVLVYRTAPDAPLIAVVNPEIEWRSEDMETAEEGCLSLPGVAVDVDRHLHIRVNAVNQSGDAILIEASGLEARVLQHEIDHLDGVLMIDRASKDQRRAAMKILREGPAERTPEASPA